VRLGFIGFADFELPNPNANIGTLKWLIAFPSGFRPQIITSGLDPVKGDPEELKVSGFNGLNKEPRLSPHHPDTIEILSDHRRHHGIG
jgi:hypothetical protein